MFFIALFFRDISALTYYNGTANTQFQLNGNVSSLDTITPKQCSCGYANTCQARCCCSSLCGFAYTSQNQDKCLPVPSTDLVQMCNSFSKNEVGSVSNWLMRTIFCVYRQNNPLTTRGETFSTPNTNYEATPEQLSNTIMNHLLAATPTPTPTPSTSGITKARPNGGYLFTQSIYDDTSAALSLVISDQTTTISLPLTFGVQQSFTGRFSSTPSVNFNTSSNLANIKIAPADTTTIVANISQPETSPYIGLAVTFLYRAFGYKQGPQYVLDSFYVNYTYYPANNAAPINTVFTDTYIGADTVVYGTINFLELPNDQNLLKTSSSADESSWLPFNWKGVNY